MEIWALHLKQLDARAHFNMTFNNSTVPDGDWARNGTRAIIAGLKLQQVQALRTMNVTLGAFSLAVALLTVHRIVSDARRTAATQLPKRFGFFEAIHPAEIFPFVLACGAVLQQIIFVSVQSTSLRKITSDQCRTKAMITFPAIFLMGYITLVFGIEMALRSLKYERFSPRGKWNTFICIGVISFLLLLTWMPTVIWPMYNRCFGSLIWFPVRYELIAIVILSILVAFSVILAALISIQLVRTSDVDCMERIAASRMCYYLLMTAVVYSLIIPVEVQAHRKNFMNTLTTSRIAEVALFTSGIVIGFFHLFLRANATRMVINPIKEESTPSSSRPKRPKIRFFGPSDLEMNISGPIALGSGNRPDSRQGLIEVGLEKNRYDFDAEYFVRPEKPLSPGSLRSLGSVDPTQWPLPPDPVSAATYDKEKEIEATLGLHKRSKSSYSLFPTRAEDIPRLPATVYSPPKSAGGNRVSKLAMRRQTRRNSLGDTKSVTDMSETLNFLSKPPNLFGGRHRRNQSTDSSATVQIGLRFSVAPATLAAAKCTIINRQLSVDTPSLRRDNSDSSVETLGLPIQAPSVISSKTTTSETPSLSKFPEPPHPQRQRSASPTKPPPSFPIPSPPKSSAYLETQRGKALPPTPRSALPMPLPPSISHNLPARPLPPMSGLRMNPVSPASSATLISPTTPRSATLMNRSPTARSPTSRLPIGALAGTMASSPPMNGWI